MIVLCVIAFSAHLLVVFKHAIRSDVVGMQCP